MRSSRTAVSLCVLLSVTVLGVSAQDESDDSGRFGQGLLNGLRRVGDSIEGAIDDARDAREERRADRDARRAEEERLEQERRAEAAAQRRELERQRAERMATAISTYEAGDYAAAAPLLRGVLAETEDPSVELRFMAAYAAQQADDDVAIDVFYSLWQEMRDDTPESSFLPTLARVVAGRLPALSFELYDCRVRVLRVETARTLGSGSMWGATSAGEGALFVRVVYEITSNGSVSRGFRLLGEDDIPVPALEDPQGARYDNDFALRVAATHGVDNLLDVELNPGLTRNWAVAWEVSQARWETDGWTLKWEEEVLFGDTVYLPIGGEPAAPGGT